MKKALIVSFITIAALALITVFFPVPNPIAKEIYDELRNFKSYADVKLSDSYKEIDSSKEYYKGEKNIPIPILIYHEISRVKAARNLYNMQTTDTRFEEQIVGLINEGYRFISYDDLIEYYNNNKPLTEKTLLIGFDDGWIGNYENAFPILKKYNIPAAIYVVDDLVGTEGYFNWEQAKEMSDSGLISIYSHGRTHVYYDKETIETLLNDVNYAFGNIEKYTGKKKNKVFTYPYGAYREDQIHALEEEGYIQNLTDDKINYSDNLDLSRLHRYYVKQNESTYQIIKNVNKI